MVCKRLGKVGFYVSLLNAGYGSSPGRVDSPGTNKDCGKNIRLTLRRPKSETCCRKAYWWRPRGRSFVN